jgi:hypothetical protein
MGVGGVFRMGRLGGEAGGRVARRAAPGLGPATALLFVLVAGWVASVLCSCDLYLDPTREPPGGVLDYTGGSPQLHVSNGSIDLEGMYARRMSDPSEWELQLQCSRSDIRLENPWWRLWAFGGSFYAAMPIWPLCVAVGIPAGVLWLRSYSQKRSAGARACRECGYDLTGNVSGRCPECGRRISAEPQGAKRAWWRNHVIWAYAVTVGAAIAYGYGTACVNAWASDTDAPVTLYIALPVLFVMNAGLGYFWPGRPWRWTAVFVGVLLLLLAGAPTFTRPGALLSEAAVCIVGLGVIALAWGYAGAAVADSAGRTGVPGGAGER